MFKLIIFYEGLKHTIEAETIDEIKSICIDAFNNNYELWEIQDKDGNCIALHCEIYDLIGKAIY